MFLIKAGLEKEAFVATGVVLAVLVDIARMIVYGAGIAIQGEAIAWPLVTGACLSAFIGAYVGAQILGKVTFRSVQFVVSGLLIVVGIGLMVGVL
jgi:uncharacterized membrane protein YfcA